jgi:hypothetical protein
MAIQKVNFPISIRRGDTSLHTFVLDHVDENGTILGPVDLTGWVFLAQARTERASGGLIYQFPVEVVPLSGLIRFYVDQTTSESFNDPLVAEWEMQATIPNPKAGAPEHTEVATFAGGSFSTVNDLVDPNVIEPFLLLPGQVGDPPPDDNIYGVGDNTVIGGTILGREPITDPVILAQIEEASIQITYQDRNEGFDVGNSLAGYLEGLNFFAVFTFDELTDTPSTKVGSSKNFVTVSQDETALEYSAPTMVEGNGISITNPLMIDNPTIDIELQPNSGLVADNTGLSVDGTIVRDSRQIIAGDGMTQTASTLATDITLNVAATAQGGLKANADDIEVDIIGTNETTSLAGTDVLLVETGSGKRRITRDNLLAGLGKGAEIRGTVNPTAVGGTPPDPLTPITTLTVTGDPDNATISQGVEPTGAYPSGFTYIILLDPVDRQTGVNITMAGPSGSPQVVLVFDGDQLVWTGSGASGQFTHLETGDNVISVHGRQGVVVADNGDYTASQITNVPSGNLIATDVQGALDEHQVDIDNLGTTISTVDSNAVHITGDEDIGGKKRFTNTDAVKVPSGVTAQRGAGEDGDFRVNTETDKVEYYSGGLWRSVETLEKWQDYARTEADMVKDRQIADQYAASGFVHYGKHRTFGTDYQPINEGLYHNLANGSLNMGRGDGAAGQSETSKTDFPVTHIAGFVSEIVNVHQSYTIESQIKFPEAPDGTVIYDSSGDARGSGNTNLDLTVDVDPKYGDVAADTNEAVARAFEGEIKNGDFRNGLTDGWSGVGWTVSNGIASTTLDPFQQLGNGFVAEVGIEYIVELTVTDWVGQDFTINVDGYGNNGLNTGTGVFTYTFTAATTNITFDLRAYTGGQSGNISVSQFTIRRATEEVVIDRHDMFGGEFFLEEVSVTNPYVYPRGMIQSQAATFEGVTTVRSNRPDSYYAVFDGDITSAGLGVDFFALTDTEKQTIVSNPVHNIYILDDGRLVQWRMRQRTIAGAGNGDWEETNHWGQSSLRFDTNTEVAIQGNTDVCPPFIKGWDEEGGVFVSYARTAQFELGLNNVGVYHGLQNGSYTPRAVNGECYFHVWGVVRRLNQGAYHPSFNPLGARRCNSANTYSTGAEWYATSDDVIPLTSTSVCFRQLDQNTNTTEAGAAQTTGYISSGATGRDDGRFYDAIYAGGDGGVNDHRLSAWDMSSKEEASKVFQKVVNGTYRGEEEVPYTWIDANVTQSATIGATSFSVSANPVNNYHVGDIVSLYDVTTGDVSVTTVVTNVSPSVVDVRDTFDRLAGNSHVVVTSSQLTSSVSGEFDMLDVMGGPTEILAEPDLASGWQGGWIPVVPTTGVALDYPATRKAFNTPSQIYRPDSSSAWVYDATLPNGWSANKNTREGITYPSTSIAIWQYTAFAKQTKESTVKSVLNGSQGIGTVFATKYSPTDQGCLLAESLMGKVPTDSTTSLAPRIFEANVSRIGINNTNGIISSGGSFGAFEHTQIDLATPQYNPNAAVKTLWYQSADNQQVSLNFAWNELVYNSGGTVGNEWGDTTAATTYTNASGSINIVDGTSTYTNLNGDTCLRGTATLSKPIGYSRNQSRAGTQTGGIDL